MTEAKPRRLTLLYQNWLLSQATSRFMRVALADTGMRGEEYGLYSYFFANGARTLTQASRDLGQPLTTLATMLAPAIERGDIVRRSHPSDRRARLLELTPDGRARLQAVIPVFTAAYRTLLHELEAQDTDIEAMFEMFERLKSAVERTTELMQLETGRSSADS
jgi:DNA-binding MarR family transcriptional regulator